MKIEVVPCGFECTLKDCPPGLFFYNGSINLKTEYGTDFGASEAFCGESGEAFWGGTGSRVAADRLKVTPCRFLVIREDEDDEE